MIYFLQAPSGPIKIGYTKDWKKRRPNLQAGSHEKLVTLLVMDGTLEEEGALHRVFAAHRVRGEWFAPVAELTAYIEAMRPDMEAAPEPAATGPRAIIKQAIKRRYPNVTECARTLGIHPTRLYAFLQSSLLDEAPVGRLRAALGDDVPAVVWVDIYAPLPADTESTATA